MMKKYQSLYSVLLYVFFSFYIVILLYFLFFSRVGLRGFDLFEVNLIPFATISEQLADLSTGLRGMAFMNLLVNVLLLAPLGLYLPILWKKRRPIVYVGLIVAISLLIEIIQLTFGLGAADIDDVILNCLGGFLGLAFYKTLLVLLKDEHRVRGFVTICSAIVGILIAIFFAVEIYQWVVWNNSIM